MSHRIHPQFHRVRNLPQTNHSGHHAPKSAAFGRLIPPRTAIVFAIATVACTSVSQPSDPPIANSFDLSGYTAVATPSAAYLPGTAFAEPSSPSPFFLGPQDWSTERDKGSLKMTAQSEGAMHSALAWFDITGTLTAQTTSSF